MGVKVAEQASRLFHLTGRKRVSHADSMEAAAAMVAGESVATRKVKGSEPFVPFGLKLLPVQTISTGQS